MPPLRLVIGQIAPLTGPQAPYGPADQEAGRLATKVLNDGAQQAGVPFTVELRVEDDQGRPDTGTQVATKLVTGGATCLSGPHTSAVALAVAQSVAIPRRIPMVAFSASSPTLTGLQDDGFVFRTIASDTLQQGVLAQLTARGLNGAQGKTINIGARNDDYGANLARGVQSSFQGMGGRVGQLVLWDPNAATYDADAQRMIQGNPDGWVIIDFVTTFQKVAPALVRTGRWDPTRTFVTALQVPQLPQLIGREATEGLRGVAPGYSRESATGSAFDQYWKANSTVGRNALEVNAFDSVILCGLASLRARSAEGPAIKQYLTEISGPPGNTYQFSQMAGAIRAAATGEDVDYQGVSGAIDLDANGDVTEGQYGIIEFKDGELVLTDVLTIRP
jgi:branched-chain amino acid transport system substrate-binding protein